MKVNHDESLVIRHFHLLNLDEDRFIYLFIYGLESKRVLRLIACDILYTSYSLKQFSTCVYNVNLKQVR